MSILAFVTQYFPNVNRSQADDLLWCCTGYPGAYHGDPLQYFGNQLKEYAERSNCNYVEAMRLAYEDSIL